MMCVSLNCAELQDQVIICGTLPGVLRTRARGFVLCNEPVLDPGCAAAAAERLP